MNSKLFILILLCSLVLSVNAVALIPGPDCPAALITPNEIYLLTGDIQTTNNMACIDITADNITLDCQGHFIKKTNPAYAVSYGINIERTTEKKTNISIKNCIVDSFGYDINLRYADFNNVSNSTLYNCHSGTCSSQGMHIQSDSNNNIINNISYIGFQFPAGDAIDIDGNFNNVTDIVILNASNGLQFSNFAHGNMIKNAIISGSIYAIYIVFSDSNTFTNLTMINSLTAGIGLTYSNNNNITNSTFQNNANAVHINNAGSSGPNLFYNNIFNRSSPIDPTIVWQDHVTVYPNYWNVTNQSGVNIWNSSLGYIGGNIWTNNSGTGYSDTCADSNGDGYCDQPYDVKNNVACTAGVDCSINTDYLPLAATRPPISVTSGSPFDGSAVIGRTVSFNYNVTWMTPSPPVNCSVFDNRTGGTTPTTYAKSNGTTPLINNSGTNYITFTYSQDYDKLAWKVRCCYPGICYDSWTQIIAVHTSRINVSASADHPQEYCLNGPANFYCNYTDGNGKPVQAALVNITFWNATSTNTYLYTNDQSVLDSSENPYVYHGVSFDSASQMFYDTISNLPMGKYNYSCSAINATQYPFNQSDTHNYTITDLYDSKIAVTTFPDYRVPQPYGQTFYFNGSYNKSDGVTPLYTADCKLIIYPNGEAGGVIINAYYNPDALIYQANTTQLLVGPNPCNFTCIETCYRRAFNLTTFIVTYGMSSSPALIFEDPLYSLKTNSTIHKVITQSPYPGSLVSNISNSASGSNWTYGMVVKLNNPTCGQLPSDTSKILLVNDSSNIYDTTACPAVNSFAGVIFQDNQCGLHVTCVLTIPYAYNFSSDIYGQLSNYSYILLNGENLVVQDISKLREFYLNGYYRASNYAPSFLMRLSGQFGPSPYGIESFVNVDSFMQNKSSVDYYYFSSQNPPAYKIKGMPNCENFTICNDSNKPHFYLDAAIANANSSGAYTHLQLYGGASTWASIIVTQHGAPIPGSPCGAGPECNSTCQCSALPSPYNISALGYKCCPNNAPVSQCVLPACTKDDDCVYSGPQPQCYTKTCASIGDCPVGSGGFNQCIFTRTSPPVYPECGCDPPCLGREICVEGRCITQADSCGNGICEPAQTEDYRTCSKDCCSWCEAVTGYSSPGNPNLDGRCHSECAGVNHCDNFQASVCDTQFSGFTTCKGDTLVTCCNNAYDCTRIGDTCQGSACIPPPSSCDATHSCPSGKHCCDCSSVPLCSGLLVCMSEAYPCTGNAAKVFCLACCEGIPC